jgi:hypothetical protein
VDLAAGSAPVGVAADYYIFAVRSDGLTGFSLDINTTPTETSTRRIIGRCYYDGTKIVKETIRSIWQAGLYGGGVSAQVAGGRLTLSSGNAVADVGASATVYYTPYTSGRIGLYVVGFGWRVYSFSQAALALAGLAIGNYDIFAYNISGEGYALTLEAVKWTTDSARATAIVQQDGVWVKNGAPERRYLGTVRLYAVATTIDSESQRFVWNVDNRVPRRMLKRADAATWSYGGAGAWRQANNSAANRVEMVVGLADAYAEMWVSCTARVSGTCGAQIGLARNGTGDPLAVDTQIINGYVYSEGTSINRWQMMGVNRSPLEVGYHYFQWVESSLGGTGYFFSDPNGAMGINGTVRG